MHFFNFRISLKGFNSDIVCYSKVLEPAPLCVANIKSKVANITEQQLVCIMRSIKN